MWLFSLVYQITNNDNILHITFAGHITNEDLLLLDKELFENESYKECQGHIYDYRQVTTFGFTNEEIKRIAMLDRNESFINGSLKIAIITNDCEIRSFSQLYVEEMQSSDWDVCLFSDFDEAQAFCTSD